MADKKSVLAFAWVLCFVLLCSIPDAEARKRGGGHHVNAHIKHGHPHASHAARRAGRHIRRAGRWANGVWVVNGVAASVVVGTATNCGYSWRKWRETGNAYWLQRYYERGCG